MWHIQPQVEKEQGVEYSVDCKHLKYFPYARQDGSTGFGLLNFTLLQVIVMNDYGTPVRLKMTVKDGETTYACQQANQYVEPLLRLGKGRVVPDMLAAEKIIRQGEKQVFHNIQEFRAFGCRVFGATLTSEIERKFNDRLQLV
jgi:hypothetical protein